MFLTQAPILRKRNDRYECEYYLNGKRCRVWVSSVDTDKEAANLAYMRICRDIYINYPIATDSMDKQPKTGLIEALESEFEEHKKTLRFHTVLVYQSSLKHFIKWITDNYTERVGIKVATVKLLESFRDYVAGWMSANGVRRTVAVVKTLLNRLVSKGLLELDTRKIRCVGGNRGIKKTYTKEQVNTLLNTAPNPELRLIYSLVHYAFIRPSEILRLSCDDIDLERGIITIPGNKSKNKKTQSVAIHPVLRSEIMRYFEACACDARACGVLCAHYSGCNRANLNSAFNTQRKKLGLSGLTIYALKHTGAQMLYHKTKDISLVKSQCRHTSIAITDVYLRNNGSIVPVGVEW